MAMRGKNWFCEEKPMSTYVVISALIFAVVAIGHAINL
jgi:hypothetical protein